MNTQILETIIVAATVVGLSAEPRMNAGSSAGVATNPAPPHAYGNVAMAFEPNRGQSDSRVKFLGRGPGYTVFLTATEAVFKLNDPAEPAVRTRLIGANASPRMTPADMLAGRSNYLIGNDPQQWRTGVPQFRKVRYDAIYPGIDLTFYGNHQLVEYDFIVSPSGNPDTIKLAIDGTRSIELEASGDLVLTARSRSIRMRRPMAYQEIGGSRTDVPVWYRVMKGHTIGFAVGAYDRRAALVIDPLVLVYSSYLGGFGWDEPNDLAIDAGGNAYVTGYTESRNFPVSSGGPPAVGGGYGDAFVTKIDASGSSIVYSTVFGGSAFDNSHAIAVDSSGAVYVAGGTTSANFPTVNALQSTFLGPEDGFIAKLDPSGASFVYSTFLGGSSIDEIVDLALGPSGEVYVAGTTTSVDLPTRNAAQASFGGGFFDTFVAKVNGDASQVLYCTYLGGSGDEYVPHLTVDSAGSAYIVGPTRSPDFPTVNALQPAFGGGFLGDAFVTKLSADGSFVFSSYLGGAGQDSAADVAVDQSGNVYVVGSTDSYNFPLVGGLPRTNYASYPDAYITKINPSGSAIVFSTRLGGSKSDGALRVTLDAVGNVYVAGFTSSEDFPVRSALLSTYVGGWDDGFVAKLNPQGSVLLQSSYVGGSLHDYVSGLAVDAAGSIYLSGITMSPDFPTLNPFQSGNNGDRDAFVTKLTWEPDPVLTANAGPDQVVPADDFCSGYVRLDGTKSTTPPGRTIIKYFWTNPSVGQAFGPTPTFRLPSLGTYTFQLTVIDDLAERASDSVDVMLADVTPPLIGAVAAAPTVLWPPNHDMLPIAVTVADVSDQCSGPATCQIDAITSNEALAPEDSQITGPLTVRLRAERLGEGTGRVYAIVIKCTDRAGNNSFKTVTVTVPHDM